MRPPVLFGERWITSIFDLFEENVRYFPALLPEITDEDPEAVLARRRGARGCRSCGCTTAPSTAGTGRCTTSCDGRPAPAGGEPGAAGRADRRRRAGQRRLLLRRAARAGRRGPAGLDEDVASTRPTSNFDEGARLRRRRGVLLARLRRGHLGRADAAPTCCPMAHEGLDRWGVDAEVRDRLPGRHRAALLKPGATAPGGRPRRCRPRGARAGPGCGAHRDAQALLQGMHSNEPVHTWEVP